MPAEAVILWLILAVSGPFVNPLQQVQARQRVFFNTAG